jgi:predicted metal-dependent phosphoesterase TrpH
MISGIDDIFTGVTSLFDGSEGIDWKAWGMQKIVQAATLGIRIGVRKLGTMINKYASTKNNKFVKGAFIHLQNKIAEKGAEQVGLINKDKAEKDFQDKINKGKELLIEAANELHVFLVMKCLDR